MCAVGQENIVSERRLGQLPGPSFEEKRTSNCATCSADNLRPPPQDSWRIPMGINTQEAHASHLPLGPIWVLGHVLYQLAIVATRCNIHVRSTAADPEEA